MQGKPNGKYIITTKPTYYVAVTDSKEGTVISADYVSAPCVAEFKDTTHLEGILDESLTFAFKSVTPKQPR